MFTLGNTEYFEIGDKVEQSAYPGAGYGTIIESEYDRDSNRGELLTISVEVAGTEWAVDENGDPCNEPKTYRTYRDDIQGKGVK